MFRPLFAGAFALMMCASAQAAMVSGWDVSPKPDEKNLCSIQYNYTDKSDGDAKNTVNLVFGKDEHGVPIVAIALGYDKWKWQKGDTRVADVLIDKTVEVRAQKWDSSGQFVLVSVFRDPDSLMKAISQGKLLTLRFDGNKDNYASFEIPNAAQATGAAEICKSQMK